MKNENKILKNKKVIFAIIALIITLIVFFIFGKGYSLFSDSKDEGEQVQISEVEVVIEEDEVWKENDDEYGVENITTKNIKGVSKKIGDTYVRVKCIPIVQYYDESYNNNEGKWITTAVSSDKIIVSGTSEYWVEDGDYWYYKNILRGLGETETLKIDWDVNEIPSEISNKKIRTDVRVILEYSQASNDVWKEVFKIEQLPEGVQNYEE
ncbi:MAG: hypothetical protein E7313_03260 [Clostridiales bacterium]|nr:hypothetical protein [Clostridiales bacterium]